MAVADALMSRAVTSRPRKVAPFALAMQYGAILYVPTDFSMIYSGDLSWVTGFDAEGPLVTIPVAPPYSSTIHLLANVNPVDAVGFNALIGRSPVEGDAVLQLDPSGAPQISLFSSGMWSSDPTACTMRCLRTVSWSFWQ